VIKITGTFPTFNTNWWESSKDEIARQLLNDNREAWAREVDPQEDSPWTPLKPAYSAWKRSKYPNEPILRASGRMLNRTTIRPENSRGIFRARMGSDYGSYHMTGTSKMGARPWLGIPQSSMPNINLIVANAINRGRNRRF